MIVSNRLCGVKITKAHYKDTDFFHLASERRASAILIMLNTKQDSKVDAGTIFTPLVWRSQVNVW